MSVSFFSIFDKWITRCHLSPSLSLKFFAAKNITYRWGKISLAALRAKPAVSYQSNRQPQSASSVGDSRDTKLPVRITRGVIQISPVVIEISHTHPRTNFFKLILSLNHGESAKRRQMRLRTADGCVRKILSRREPFRTCDSSPSPSFQSLEFFRAHGSIPHFFKNRQGRKGGAVCHGVVSSEPPLFSPHTGRGGGGDLHDL